MAKIQVTQSDIDNGVIGNPRFCPVANALHRQGYPRPTVTKGEVRLPTGAHFPLPDSVSLAIRIYDRGVDDEGLFAGVMYPFEFEVGGAS